PRRIEWSGCASHADLPIDFRVVRLEILVRDRPIREARTLEGSARAGFLEVDLTETPEVRREVHARAADEPTVDESGLHPRFVRRRLTERGGRLLVIGR